MGIIILKKLHEDAENIYITEIRLPSGQSLPITDKDGFPMVKIDENGNVLTKGSVKKLTGA